MGAHSADVVTVGYSKRESQWCVATSAVHHTAPVPISAWMCTGGIYSRVLPGHPSQFSFRPHTFSYVIALLQ